MLFGGLQKLTLLDYPDKMACTVFTQGCNFRCPFCHNASLVLPEKDSPSIGEEELLAFLETRRGLLDGLCISGGEPLMHREISGFIKKVRELGFAVKLDTNGSYPERLEKLLSEGLFDYVAMDIKNTPERYAETIGLADYDTGPILESISLLLGASIPCEFRTTVVRGLHGADELRSIAGLISGAGSYYLQAFVDSGELLGEGMSGYSESGLESLLSAVREILPVTQLRGV